MNRRSTRGAAAKHLTPEIRPVLAQLAATIARSASSTPAAAEQAVRGSAEQAGVKAAALIHATRVAVTGRAVSAGLFEVLALLGSERVTARLNRAVNYTPRGSGTYPASELKRNSSSSSGESFADLRRYGPSAGRPSA